MAAGHTFWWGLTMACILWYSTMTIYVGIRGFADIKSMLANLTKINDEENAKN